MSEEYTNLDDLVNLAFRKSQETCVNKAALHTLLLAVVKDIREMKTQLRDSPPGDRHPDAGSSVTAPSDAASPSSSPSSVTVDTCQDLSTAMKLIQELHNERDNLKEDIQEIRQQQKVVADQVEKCCHRVDALEETVRDAVQKSEEENHQKVVELVDSGVVDVVTVVEPTCAPASPTSPSSSSPPPHPAEDTVRPAAPSSPTPSEEVLTLQEAADTTESPSVLSGSPPQGGAETAAGMPPSQKISVSECCTQTADSLKDTERFNQLEARVAAMEEGKVDQTQLIHLKELVCNKDPQDALDNLRSQLNQQRALLDGLLSDREKLDDLRDLLEDRTLPLTFELSSSLQDEVGQDESDILDQSSDRSTDEQDTVDSLIQQQSGGGVQLQQDSEARQTSSSRQNVVLVNSQHMQMILRLKAACEKLHETTWSLRRNTTQQQNHIEELYNMMEELDVRKADKQMVVKEIKADKSALDSKVSRLQLDTATEQLNSMFHELLNKVTGQEQEWHKVIDKLSAEMECKLNRIELDSVKKELEHRWRKIQEQLQAQGAPEHEDAAGLRKQLVDKFHCLSCDRPVVKHTPGPHLVTLPSSPAFPSCNLMRRCQHYRSLKPGTNPHSSEDMSVRTREELLKSHAVMCRQVESLERHKHCNSITQNLLAPGCTSQSSISQASAAAESSTKPQSNKPLDP